jgi:hypothetical protein
VASLAGPGENWSQGGASVIKKPSSVRVAGWVGLAVFVFNLVGTLSTRGHRLPPDAEAGRAIVFFISFVLGLVWLVGTVLHRSRINRMRYR